MSTTVRPSGHWTAALTLLFPRAGVHWKLAMDALIDSMYARGEHSTQEGNTLAIAPLGDI